MNKWAITYVREGEMGLQTEVLPQGCIYITKAKQKNK